MLNKLIFHFHYSDIFLVESTFDGQEKMSKNDKMKCLSRWRALHMEIRNQIFFVCSNPLESFADIFQYLNLIPLLIQKNWVTRRVANKIFWFVKVTCYACIILVLHKKKLSFEKDQTRKWRKISNKVQQYFRF